MNNSYDSWSVTRFTTPMFVLLPSTSETGAPRRSILFFVTITVCYYVQVPRGQSLNLIVYTFFWV